MPKRDERGEFSDAFDGNPFAGDSPQQAYEALQWGNAPRNVWDIEAPEPLVLLGNVAKLFFTGGEQYQWDEQHAPFLAVGLDSNTCYVLHKKRNGRPHNLYLDPRSYVGDVRRTDYYSDKGGEPAYYYHDHQAPYPQLWEVEGGYVLLPSSHEGRRSYAVVKEGIVG